MREKIARWDVIHAFGVDLPSITVSLLILFSSGSSAGGLKFTQLLNAIVSVVTFAICLCGAREVQKKSRRTKDKARVKAVMGKMAALAGGGETQMARTVGTTNTLTAKEKQAFGAKLEEFLISIDGDGSGEVEYDEFYEVFSVGAVGTIKGEISDNDREERIECIWRMLGGEPDHGGFVHLESLLSMLVELYAAGDALVWETLGRRCQA